MSEIRKGYHTKFFPGILLVTEMRKIQIVINKSVYFDLSIIDLSNV